MHACWQKIVFFVIGQGQEDEPPEPTKHWTETRGTVSKVFDQEGHSGKTAYNGSFSTQLIYGRIMSFAMFTLNLLDSYTSLHVWQLLAWYNLTKAGCILPQISGWSGMGNIVYGQNQVCLVHDKNFHVYWFLCITVVFKQHFRHIKKGATFIQYLKSYNVSTCLHKNSANKKSRRFKF